MRASRTAMMIAAYRARASKRDAAFIQDPWASALAGDDGFAVAELMDESWPQGELYIAVRTAYIDAQLDRFTSPPWSFRQVVILGAGLDTRAARLAKRGVRFFEVDTPATTDEKRRRIAELDGYPIDGATHVTCDFLGEDFVDVLEARGFRRDEPAFIVWEGVTYYLTEAAVRASLGSVADRCDPRTVTVFDFFGKKIVHASQLREHNLRSRETVAGLGEPLRFGMNDILPLAYDEGMRFVRVTSFDEAALYFTQSYERSREFRFQWMALVAVQPPELI